MKIKYLEFDRTNRVAAIYGIDAILALCERSLMDLRPHATLRRLHNGNKNSYMMIDIPTSLMDEPGLPKMPLNP